MHKTLTLLLILLSSCLLAQTSPMFKKYSVKQFKNEGIDIAAYQWNNQVVNDHFNAAERNFRMGNGLLAGGLASGAIGSGAVIVGSLNKRISPSVNPLHVPLLWTGIGLDLVIMPVCFVVRDVMQKKAIKHILTAKSKLTNP